MPIDFACVFNHFDEDGDGKLSPTELWKCMRLMGEELSVEEVKEVVESLDSEGDGLLRFDDFVKLVQVETGEEGGEDDDEEKRNKYLKEAFKVYRTEEEDCITVKSLRRALSRLGEKKSDNECEVMIGRFDLDGDGVISFDEFRGYDDGVSLRMYIRRE